MPEVLLPAALKTFPTPWVMAAAAFTGAAVAAATSAVRKSEDPEAARSRHLTAAAFLMSAAVAMWLLAVFVPGPRRIVHIKYVVFYLALTALCAAGFRFRKTVGMLLVVGAIVAGAVGYVFSTSLEPMTGSTEIGRLTVYARSAGALDAELQSPGRPLLSARLRGDRLVPVARTVEFDDLWPALGWRSWYRLEGMTACAAAGRGEALAVTWERSPALFERESTAAELFYAYFESRAAALPGVRLSRAEDALEARLRLDPSARTGTVEELVRYGILLRAGAEYELVPADR